MSQEPIGVPLPVDQQLLDHMKQRASEFRDELTSLLNRFSCENGSDTPDWILTSYVIGCLANFDTAVVAREAWEGRQAGGRSIPPQAFPKADR